MPSAPVSELELVHRGYRFALSLTHDSNSAEDLVQDAWLSMLRAGAVRTPAYLFAAIRHRFIDRYRHDRRMSAVPLTDEFISEPGDDGRDEGGYGEIELDSAALKRALSRLRPQERMVLFLSAVEGFTTQEIAEQAEMPRGTVLSTLHRTRAKLRELLGHKVPEV